MNLKYRVKVITQRGGINKYIPQVKILWWWNSIESVGQWDNYTELPSMQDAITVLQEYKKDNRRIRYISFYYPHLN